MPTQNPPETDRLIPIGAAAAILGVSVDTVRTYEKSGRLTATRTAGNQRRFRYSQVAALAAAGSAA